MVNISKKPANIGLLCWLSAVIKSEMKNFFAILFVLLLPNLLYASSSDDQVRTTVTRIYQLEKSFDKIIQASDNEEIIKKEFKAIITSLTTGDLLNRWNDFISGTPIRSTFYRTVFESMTPIKGLDITSISASGSRATAEVKLQVSELYAPSIDMVSLEELFAKYKINNMTIPEVISMLPTSSLAELVEYRITSKRMDTHKLRYVNGIWKINKIDQKIISSTIEVKVPKKSKQ